MIPTAYAATYTVKSLATSIINLVLNPISIFLGVLAILWFLWGLFQFMAGASNEEARDIGKRHMVAGLIGLFIMISAVGIMYLITNTFGFRKPDLNNLKSEGTKYDFKEPYQKK